MRRILLFLLVVTGSFLATSCLTIEERVKLNADGSGVQTLTMDMSSMLDNPMMKMGLEQELAKGGEMMRKDSTFNIIDEMAPLNPQWSDADRELVGRMEGRITMDLEEGIGMVTTTFPFQNVGEMTRFSELMKSANKAEDEESPVAGNPFSGMNEGSIMNSIYAIKGTKLTRTTPVPDNFENPFLSEEMEEGVMDMMMEMFGDATIVYVMEFPGAVKKVKGFPGHMVDGNELILAFDFTEMMEDPTIMAKALSGEVKFRK